MSMAKIKILLVDDSKTVMGIMKALLGTDNYELVEAENGDEGLEKALRHRPNLIISDVVMPGMDGYRLYREIKKNPITSNIPVLILTTRGKMQDTFIMAGVDAFIAKPFDGNVFLAKVHELLGIAASKPPEFGGVKFLVAGAHREVVEGMVMQLKDEGAKTDFAANGSEVISKAVTFLPNVIILEVQITGMSSSEVVIALKSLPQCEKTPILIFDYSPFADPESDLAKQALAALAQHRDACLTAGAARYIGSYDHTMFIKGLVELLKPPAE